jgi:hypothetical protein|tara:strand:- start:3625 stop:4527 length:903 start_codon:yes stop_codon:yes gene_type:complete
MAEKMFKAWMPLTKSSNGTFVGILSDNSLDRDEEYMTKELLDSWAMSSTPLPMLANHENKMEKFIGGWTNKKVVRKGENSALVAEPFFFSKDASPLAAQIKKQVEEALEHNMGIGISIGAIPMETVEKEIDGKRYKGFSKAEIVEATVVPIQSNRNATFVSVAKSFNLEQTEKSKMEEIKKEAIEEVVEKQAEEVVEKAEEVKDDVSEEPAGELKEKVEDAPSEEKAEEGLSSDDAQAVVEENKDLKVELEKAKVKIEALEKEAVLKATVEGPIVKEVETEVAKDWTVEEMFKAGLNRRK